MIAQHKEGTVAQIGHQSRLLVIAERDALVIVVGQTRQHDHRLLRDGKQAVLLGRNGDAVLRMHVNDAGGIFARGVNGTVDREAGRIDRIPVVEQNVAVQVDLHQTRRRDFLKQHPIRIDKEGVLGAGHPRRNVGEDQVVPAVQGDEAVAGGKIDPELPFVLGYPVADAFEGVVAQDAHGA